MKRTIRDLAAFGGAPEFAEPLVLGKPGVGNRQRLFTLLGEALDRGWLTNGAPLAGQFERQVAEVAGTRHAVLTCNATVALQLAIRALGLTGEVIVPALTFAATAHAVSWLGLRPVFCDVHPVTGQLDPAHAESLIGPETSAILAVHLWGNPCAIGELEELAARRGLALLFDAAHAFGCTWRGKPIGGFGSAEVFSFHSTKFVNSFEGGAIVTDDDALAGRAVALRNFGITGPDEVSHVGTNGKMHEASAAMGLTSLAELERFRERNRRNYQVYRKGLASVAGVRLIEFDEREQHNYQYVVILVDEEITGLSRDELARLLYAENVVTRRYFYPGCHTMAPYATAQPLPNRLPNTEDLAARCLALPTGAAATPQQARKVAELVGFLAESGREVTARLTPVRGDLMTT